MPRINEDVAVLLSELATLTKLEDGSAQSFRVRAYERAVDAVRSLAESVSEMQAGELKAVEGIGGSTADKIREYVDTGKIEKLERLRAAYPPDLVELMRIPGMGPKTVILVRDRLGVRNVADLRAAIAEERLRALPGMGAKTEEKIAHAIERLGLHGKERRTPIIDVLPVAEQIVTAMRALPGVVRAEYAGSLRRFRETIGDVDALVAATDPGPVMDAFVSLPIVADVLARGDTKSAVLTASGLQVDLRVVAPDAFGAALLYFTGSKTHNIQLRQRAIERGSMLNEYGLFTGDDLVASETEESVYAALGLPWIAPTLREGIGEISAAESGALPDLVEVEDLRGDLHVHSTWSGDGRSTLEDMLEAAAARGLEYVAITEHGEDLAINGLSREQVVDERAVLDDLRPRFAGMAILHGSELNIGREGGIDYDPEFLAGFDWCVASVHTLFDLPQAEQTRRVIAAMENPAVDVIGHLTGRRIGMRPGIELDLADILDAAAETQTPLEINCHLDRLDVPSDMLLQAREHRDILFTISTDSHHVTEYANARWGVRNAQRGWVEAERVVNTWPWERFAAWSARKR